MPAMLAAKKKVSASAKAESKRDMDAERAGEGIGDIAEIEATDDIESLQELDNIEPLEESAANEDDADDELAIGEVVTGDKAIISDVEEEEQALTEEAEDDSASEKKEKQRKKK